MNCTLKEKKSYFGAYSCVTVRTDIEGEEEKTNHTTSVLESGSERREKLLNCAARRFCLLRVENVKRRSALS